MQAWECDVGRNFCELSVYSLAPRSAAPRVPIPWTCSGKHRGGKSHQNHNSVTLEVWVFCHKNTGFDCFRVKKLFLGMSEGFIRAGCQPLPVFFREHLFLLPEILSVRWQLPLCPSDPRGLTAQNLPGEAVPEQGPSFSPLSPALPWFLCCSIKWGVIKRTQSTHDINKSS